MAASSTIAAVVAAAATAAAAAVATTQTLTAAHVPTRRPGTSESGDSWDIFICHGSCDKRMARSLYHRLTAMGLRVFLDVYSLDGRYCGNEEALARMARCSTVVIVLVSKYMLVTTWAVAEAEAALDPASQCVVLPVLADAEMSHIALRRWMGTPAPAGEPHFLIQYMDSAFSALTENGSENMDKWAKADKDARVDLVRRLRQIGLAAYNTQDYVLDDILDDIAERARTLHADEMAVRARRLALQSRDCAPEDVAMRRAELELRGVDRYVEPPDLAIALDRLAPGGRTLVVCGLPGSGKSELARAIGRASHSNVAWIPPYPGQCNLALCDALVNYFGVARNIFDDNLSLEALGGRLADKLGRTTVAMLLIFDGVDDPTLINCLAGVVSDTSHSVVVTTTSDSMPGSGTIMLPLDVLPHVTASAVFRAYLPEHLQNSPCVAAAAAVVVADTHGHVMTVRMQAQTIRSESDLKVLAAEATQSVTILSPSRRRELVCSKLFAHINIIFGRPILFAHLKILHSIVDTQLALVEKLRALAQLGLVALDDIEVPAIVTLHSLQSAWLAERLTMHPRWSRYMRVLVFCLAAPRFLTSVDLIDGAVVALNHDCSALADLEVEPSAAASVVRFAHAMLADVAAPHMVDDALLSALTELAAEAACGGADIGAIAGELVLPHASAVTDAGLKCDALREPAFSNLVSVCLAGCVQITNEGVRVLIQRAAKQLNSLDLAGCVEISDDLALVLAGVFKQLETLSVARCPRITDKLFNTLSHVQIWVSLTSLDVSGCGVGVGALEFVLRDQHAPLVELYVSECPGIDTQAVDVVARYGHLLSRLDVSYCGGITLADLLPVLANFSAASESGDEHGKPCRVWVLGLAEGMDGSEAEAVYRKYGAILEFTSRCKYHHR
ncbi:uncharacterized protein AMSG_01571 [Thecamonas trahens ATCC 50062]|uniref:TIR domain-containing protein n=1 Tax=Thecamonas trahens ATCC 50062 TaxID=461836 RepID=A0A0L0DRS6_THETB|nr:hypothetical protein AMSG_01571 [Thecamonas trahens ATCC 50062]KNC54721.1 hypothetical protein AMSG_01571 [Thecamonas trahens ATCC 50062]|eukprot:XP_013761621.1 hypothetical protein AMSG_01571 [Thecamonas trahens ATCC 50062]